MMMDQDLHLLSGLKLDLWDLLVHKVLQVQEDRQVLKVLQDRLVLKELQVLKELLVLKVMMQI